MITHDSDLNNARFIYRHVWLKQVLSLDSTRFAPSSYRSKFTVNTSTSSMPLSISSINSNSPSNQYSALPRLSQTWLAFSSTCEPAMTFTHKYGSSFTKLLLFPFAQDLQFQECPVFSAVHQILSSLPAPSLCRGQSDPSSFEMRARGKFGDFIPQLARSLYFESSGDVGFGLQSIKSRTWMPWCASRVVMCVVSQVCLVSSSVIWTVSY